MTEDDISNVLGTRLIQAALGLTVYSSNVEVPTGAPRPYIRAQVVPTNRQARDLKGSKINSEGMFMLFVVGETGEFETETTQAADAVAAVFPAALTLPVTGGSITILQPPFIGGGYLEGVNWIKPIRVRYRARSV